MADHGMIFVDGSRLLASIKEIWRTRPEFQGRRLKIDMLSEHLMSMTGRYIGQVVRVAYYFKRDDKQVEKLIIVPDVTRPGAKNHWQIIECAQSLPTIPDEQLQRLDEKWRTFFPRGEKGLDMRLACDALSAVVAGRIMNEVFLVNDEDFIPLFEAIQRLGGNIYLIALDSVGSKRLAELSDHVFSLAGSLGEVFESKKVEPVSTEVESERVSSS